MRCGPRQLLRGPREVQERQALAAMSVRVFAAELSLSGASLFAAPFWAAVCEVAWKATAWFVVMAAHSQRRPPESRSGVLASLLVPAGVWRRVPCVVVPLGDTLGGSRVAADGAPAFSDSFLEVLENAASRPLAAACGQQ